MADVLPDGGPVVTLPIDFETPGVVTLPAASGPTPGTVLAPGIAPAPPVAGAVETTVGAVRGEARSAAVVVLGLDLSLRRTGLATATHAEILSPPSQLDGFARLRWIRSSILGRLAGITHVVVEGLSYGSHTPSALERAGLWHLVMVAVDARGLTWTQIPPKTLKKYATGSGNADKGQVLAAAIRRLPQDVDNDNTADAAWLCAIGHDLHDEPLVQLPATQHAAIDKHREMTHG